MSALRAGVVEFVTSHELREETEGVLAEKFGWTTTRLEVTLGGVWGRAVFVRPAEPDDFYANAVRDADDELLLRTAGGLLTDPERMLRRRFIVTDNTKDILGRHFGDFAVRSSLEYIRELKADLG